MKQIQKIVSRENQKLKFVRKVRDGKIKDAIFIEGVRLAEEILRSNLEIKEAFINANFADNQRGENLLEQIFSRNIDIFELPDNLFQTLADTNQPQGIIFITAKPETSQEKIERVLDENSEKLTLVIFLHEINNPSNLGAILRTAEAAGVADVIISRNSADVFSPKSLRAAMGANLRLNIWENAEFEEVLNWAKKRNLISTAADINSKKKYTETDWKKGRLLIFGSEAHGLSADLRTKIDELTYIPMENEVESLNLAVSCGIILFEAKRQREI